MLLAPAKATKTEKEIKLFVYLRCVGVSRQALFIIVDDRCENPGETELDQWLSWHKIHLINCFSNRSAQ